MPNSDHLRSRKGVTWTLRLTDLWRDTSGNLEVRSVDKSGNTETIATKANSPEAAEGEDVDIGVTIDFDPSVRQLEVHDDDGIIYPYEGPQFLKATCIGNQT